MATTSIHTYEYSVGDRAQANRAVCDCGWEGPWHPIHDHRSHRRDFRAHIFAELGEEMAYYEAPVVCVNCEYRGPAKLLVGTDVWAGTCPTCMASGRLRPEDLHDTRQREGSPWFG